MRQNMKGIIWDQCSSWADGHYSEDTKVYLPGKLSEKKMVRDIEK